MYVSLDRDEDQFNHYCSYMADVHGTWLAIPYSSGRVEREQLASTFGVMGIPTLTVVGSDGTVLATNARGAVSGDEHGAGFPWEGASGGGGASALWVVLLVIIVLWVYLPKVFRWVFVAG